MYAGILLDIDVEQSLDHPVHQERSGANGRFVGIALFRHGRHGAEHGVMGIALAETA